MIQNILDITGLLAKHLNFIVGGPQNDYTQNYCVIEMNILRVTEKHTRF